MQVSWQIRPMHAQDVLACRSQRRKGRRTNLATLQKLGQVTVEQDHERPVR